MLPRPSRGGRYDGGANGSLEWAGDTATPGVERADNGTAPAPAGTAPSSSNGQPKAGGAAPAVDYDDGFGPMPPAEKTPVTASSPAPPAAGQPVARTLDLSGLIIAGDRLPVIPPPMTRLGRAESTLVETTLAAVSGPLAPAILALPAAASVAGVSIGVGPCVSAANGASQRFGLRSGVVFGPDGGIGVYGVP